MLFGWTALGSIGKKKETAMTTVVTAIFQVFGLGLLTIIGKFNLINLAILRGLTELVMMLLR